MSTSRKLKGRPFWGEKQLSSLRTMEHKSFSKKYRLKQYSETCIKQNLAEVIRESHLPKKVLKMVWRRRTCISVRNILFSGDPVFPAWKVSTDEKVVSGGPEKTQKCCFIYFLTGNFKKLFVNHIGILFFPVWVYLTKGHWTVLFMLRLRGVSIN